MKPIAHIASHPRGTGYGIVVSDAVAIYVADRRLAEDIAHVINGAVMGYQSVLVRLLDAYNTGDMAAWLEAADAARQALEQTGEAT